jgi:periplasmic copper chaperone A
MQIERMTLMSITRAIACIALLSAVFAAPLRAEEVKAGDLVITQTWSRATPGGAKIAGGFLTIENRGSATDRRLGRSRR